MNPVPASLRAVVVGTGRSGSGYIARALTAAGVRCGHEQVWGFGKPDSQLVVESSWLAVRFLPLPFVIWHQVRHPEAHLRSRITATVRPDPRLARLRGEWFPPHPDPVIHAMRRYVVWNLACERWASRRWRVEDVDGGLVAELAAEIGVACDPARVAEVPTDVNKHTRDEVVWTLDDLPAGADRDAVMAMGERYGYW